LFIHYPFKKKTRSQIRKRVKVENKFLQFNLPVTHPLPVFCPATMMKMMGVM